MTTRHILLHIQHRPVEDADQLINDALQQLSQSLEQWGMEVYVDTHPEEVRETVREDDDGRPEPQP